ncbi:hypothetical protein M406DRAFT_325166 [Cryphonectria parasitica EP155]|uniref:Thaumatin-like protein n=1 Tax=Cryphonectria parasitica (strain ATCC 38755 / EP155) TaxID=660469 RepID=A0A9P4YAW9_CRYP1|nr:uncharacterized protein M406DRAFT_325166 [Cryphonectria parasitica EP155]KAF3769673.1 hypothetical protein M406DRAFT_325166 [Cryphonectria parasitica EP155]
MMPTSAPRISLFFFFLLAAIIGAAAATTADLGAVGVEGAYPYQISVVNRHHSSIHLRILDNHGSPKASPSAEGDRVLEPGLLTSFQVPIGWGGNVQVNEARFPAWSGHEGLIEATFGPADGPCFDVSYILDSTGYTVPIVCGCVEDGMVVGCNLDLRELNNGQCPEGQDDGNGACINEARGDMNLIKAPSFFQPCDDAVYVIESGHKTQNGDSCRETSTITCCIGSSCDPSDKQE